MKEIRVVVCDDEAYIVAEMESLLERYQRESGRRFAVRGVIDSMEEKDFDADLLFLDIEMPGLSGLDIRDRLEEERRNTLIIFVTSHAESVYEAFGRNVIGFFEKPMDYGRLVLLMEKFFKLYSVFEAVELTPERTVLAGDILYIKVKDVYSTVFLTSGETLDIRRGLTDLEKVLPEGSFLRIQPSLLVNCQYIREMKKNKLRLDNSAAEFTISTRRVKECQEKYNRYCRDMARYGR